MNNLGNIKHVFASSNTCAGFNSLFHSVVSKQNANKIYIIKGGALSSKSNFIKQIGSTIVDEGIDVEYYHCPTDPDCLNGVYIPRLSIAIVDGNAPNNIDPSSPMLIENIINFGDFLSEEKLSPNKDAILECNNIVTRCFEKSFLYLESAYAIYRAYIFTTQQAVNKLTKITYENSIFKNITQFIPDNQELGSARYLFGYAITGDGLVDNIHTIIGKSKNIYLIKESPVCNSKELMSRLRDYFIQFGYNIECYLSPIDTDKIEDIIIPELSLAITVSNIFRKPKVFPTDIFDLTNSIDIDVLESFSLEADKDFKLMQTLFEKAYCCIASVKRNQDILDAFYIAATDLTALDELSTKILEEILEYK